MSWPGLRMSVTRCRRGWPGSPRAACLADRRLVCFADRRFVWSADRTFVWSADRRLVWSVAVWPPRTPEARRDAARR